jgi:hypothetical protein
MVTQYWTLLVLLAGILVLGSGSSFQTSKLFINLGEALVVNAGTSA